MLGIEGRRLDPVTEGDELREGGQIEHRDLGIQRIGEEALTEGPGQRAPALEQIRVGWNRRRRSTAPVNLLHAFEIDRIHTFRRNHTVVPSKRDPI